MRLLPISILVFCGWTCCGIWPSSAFELFVGPDGSDAWSGRVRARNAAGTDGALASLQGARNVVRALRGSGRLPQKGVTVTVQGGVYPLSRTFELAAEDSGTADSPIVYRAAPGAQVRVLGGQVVRGFKPVSDPAVLSRLDESARGHVLEVNLQALGISDYGNASGGGLELFFAEKPMSLARWPNDGFTRIADVLGKTPVDVRGTKGCAEGIFTYEGDRPARWVNEPDAWLHGYWFWDWSDQRQKVKALDPAEHKIELQPPYHGYGYRKGQWFYAYNLLSEIDQPGEWFLDRAAGTLYFWPPALIDSAQAIVSVLPTLVRMDNVSHVELRGLIFEAARGVALTISGGTSNRITRCTLRNMGGSALAISGGFGHAVVGCDVYQCGAGGISLSGGDRTKLTSGGHWAENNHIHHYGRWEPMYSAGISLSGVGLRATHNLIDNAPHQAIGFGGNDHLIEFNEIHSVCFESNDAGAIYAGRDWTMRGTVIRNNYLHDITGFEGRGCVGVYLDDMYCGTDIISNLFYRVTQAAFIGGGRDCRIENNLFVECDPAVHVDARALGWAHYHADEWVKEGHEKGTLSGIAFQQPPYSLKYPPLINILNEDPNAPKGNVVARNICSGGRWADIEGKAKSFLTERDNLINGDPHFVNAAAHDYRLQKDSPALALGFEPVPIEKMGLYQSEERASWPVRTEVRPAKMPDRK